MKNKIYTCVDHATFYPIGGASVIVAKDKKEGNKLMREILKERGLDATDFNLKEIDISVSQAIILRDGDY